MAFTVLLSNNSKKTIFTASDTWTKDPRAQSITLYGCNSGYGGASGRKGASTSAGGGGGGAGGRSFMITNIAATFFGNTETVTIGSTANGGNAQTADSTNGNVGALSNITSFGNITIALNGVTQATGGTTTVAPPSSTGGCPFFSWGAVATFPGAAWITAAGNAGQGSNVAAVDTTNSTYNVSIEATGGGGGSGGDTGTGRTGGKSAGYLGMDNSTVIITGTAGGSADNGGSDGNPASTSGAIPYPGLGGGGGGGQHTVGAGLTGGKGGNGGIWGGGGAGGGGGLNTTDLTGGSGAGGTGARGTVIVIEYF